MTITKVFKVCDVAHGNQCNKSLSWYNDYALINKGKSAVRKNNCVEEIYDTTHDNKENKQHLDSNNEYAVLHLRSDNIIGVERTKRFPAADGHVLYYTAEGSKFQTMLQPNNDYAVFKSNNEAFKAKGNTLYDNNRREKKMQPVNNDYEFGSEDCE
jgi:hypothetical protein